MKPNSKILAIHIHPLPNGIRLYKKDLDNEEKVLLLFDSCQILRSGIFAEGWHYLLEKFGLIKLYQIDLRSGWFDTENKEDWLESILYNSLLSGFNPQTGSFGEYDENAGVFMNSSKNSEVVDWDKFKSRAYLLYYED